MSLLKKKRNEIKIVYFLLEIFLIFKWRIRNQNIQMLALIVILSNSSKRKEIFSRLFFSFKIFSSWNFLLCKWWNEIFMAYFNLEFVISCVFFSFFLIKKFKQIDYLKRREYQNKHWNLLKFFNYITSTSQTRNRRREGNEKKWNLI